MRNIFHATPAQWMTAALAATALLALPGPAKADHDSFVYGGPTYGFHGEASIIKALEYLELEYVADDGSHEPIRRATWQTRRAYRSVCHPLARYYLGAALQHMGRFEYGHDLVELDAAAGLLNKALVVEQRKHNSHHAHVVPGGVVHPQTIIGSPYRPVRGRHTYWGPRYPRREISFGSRRGGFSIRF